MLNKSWSHCYCTSTMTINYLMLTVCFNASSFIPHSILQRQLFLPPFTRWENLRLKEPESCTEGRTHSRSRAGLGTLAPHPSVRFRSSVLSQHVQKLLQAGEVGSHEGSDSERPLKLVVPVEKSLWCAATSGWQAEGTGTDQATGFHGQSSPKLTSALY